MGAIRKIYKKFRWSLRDKYIGKKQRQRLQNSNFSVIASDCTAGMLYHDLKCEFNTPTINFFFSAPDFIKFCNNIQHYIDIPMVAIPPDEEAAREGYPLAKIDDIVLHLVHYSSVEQAQECWDRRKTRINFNNLFIVMNDRNGCTKQDLLDFDQLPYKNKVVFTHVPHPEIKSSYYIHGFENQETVGTMTKFVNPIAIKRNMDQFDFVTWINGMKSQ